MQWPLANRRHTVVQEQEWNGIPDPVLDAYYWGDAVEQAIRDLDYNFAEQQAKRGQYAVPIREHKR